MVNNKIKYYILACLTFYSVTVTANHNDVLNVVYPSSVNHELRESYEIELLKLILNKSGMVYKLTPSSYRISSDISAINALIKKEKITVLWTKTNKEIEKTKRCIHSYLQMVFWS